MTQQVKAAPAQPGGRVVPGPHLFPSRPLPLVIDCKPSRPLTGPGTVPITDLVPGRVVAYESLPFLHTVEALMAVDSQKTPSSEYSAARKALFPARGVSRIPFVGSRLVFTQPRVNTARVAEMAADLVSSGGDAPGCLVRFEGDHYVMNGHHRLVAWFLSQRRDIVAHVLTV